MRFSDCFQMHFSYSVLRSIQNRSSRLFCRKRFSSTMSSLPPAPQIYENFLVLDFEATCDTGTPMEPQEIIEFPVLKISAKDLEVKSIFHHYVRPIAHPNLTDFCTKLTGIVQEMVDNQHVLPEVLEAFRQWAHSENITDSNSLFVTCGDWDLHLMLPRQLENFGYEIPSEVAPLFCRWFNVKKGFCQVTGSWPHKGLMTMLDQLGIEHKGRHHSGIDDCQNIASILIALIRKYGLVVDYTKQAPTLRFASRRNR